MITDEEEKLKQSSLIRCLNYENSENDELDEIDELATMNKEIKQEKKFEEESIPEPMLDHDYEEHGPFGSPQNTDISTSSDDSVEQLSFKNKHELMTYISKNLTVDEIFEQLTKAEEASVKRKELIGKVVKTVGFEEFLGEYFTVPVKQETKLTVEQNEVITTVLSEVSSLMSTNLNVRHKVLDVLSEKHSHEFLDHALQENSTAKVCDILTLPCITNYIIHKVNSSDDESKADDINRMNRAILQKLITSTNSNGKEIISNRNETQDMMKLLFRNKPKIDIFDTVHEFLRNIVQNH